MNYTSLQAKLHGMEFKVPTEFADNRNEQSSFTPEQDQFLDQEMLRSIERKKQEFLKKNG